MTLFEIVGSYQGIPRNYFLHWETTRNDFILTESKIKFYRNALTSRGGFLNVTIHRLEICPKQFGVRCGVSTAGYQIKYKLILYFKYQSTIKNFNESKMSQKKHKIE